MLFWLVATASGLIAAGVLVRAMIGGTDGAARADRAAAVYKAQLAEVEADLARGLLTEVEAKTLRTEVSRRLLAAADAAGQERAEGAPPALNGAMAALVAVAVLGGSAGIYALIGAPGAPDLPREQALADAARAYAERTGQAEMAATITEAGGGSPPPIPEENAALLDQLRSVLEARPEDVRGHRLLADNLGRLAQWADAAEAQARLLALLAEEATADDHQALAEYLIFAVNGYVSPEAEAALRAALARDPDLPRARYFLGLSAAQAGRPDLAYDLWTRLLQEGPANAPWVASIRDQLPEVAAAAGLPLLDQMTPADTSDAQVAAFEAMPPEEQEMVRGMVARLSDRLATDGGPAEDWAQLIRSLGIIGERGQADAIYTEAKAVFAESEADLALLRQAARAADILQ